MRVSLCVLLREGGCEVAVCTRFLTIHAPAFGLRNGLRKVHPSRQREQP